MKKKRNLYQELSVYLIIFSFSFMILVNAQLGGLEDDLEKVEEAGETITDIADGNFNQSYLAEEWTKQIREKAPWIYSLDPIFKFLFAYRFELSWAFVAAFLLWAIQFAFYYPPLNMFIENPLFSLPISGVLAALSSQLIVPRSITFMANFVEDIWTNIGIIILLIIILAILNQSSAKLTKLWKKTREERRIKKLEDEAKKSQAMRQGVQKMRQGADAAKRGRDSLYAS